MDFAKELHRHLVFKQNIFDAADDLEQFSDPLSEKKPLIAAREHLFNEVKDELSWEGEVQIADDVGFKEMFAHHSCSLFAAALREMADVDQTYAFVTEDGMAAHYFCSMEHEGETYYLDAYGVFSDIDRVTERYQLEGTHEVVDFENDDLPTVRSYRDNEAGLIDEMPGEDCGEQVEYAELYYERLLVHWAKGVHDAVFENVHDATASM